MDNKAEDNNAMTLDTNVANGGMGFDLADKGRTILSEATIHLF